jgi:hypothetical protein
VALEATFRELSVSLHHLYETLNEVQVTLGDKPLDDESALADDVETTVLDLMGTLHGARKAALLARKAVGHPADLEQARRSLTNCQKHFHEFERQFASDLVSYEKLRELARLGSERPAWLPWSSTVKQGIEQCQPPLHTTSKSLAACWQELVEQSGKTSISIRTENLGQKIFAKGTRDTVGSSAT